MKTVDLTLPRHIFLSRLRKMGWLCEWQMHNQHLLFLEQGQPCKDSHDPVSPSLCWSMLSHSILKPTPENRKIWKCISTHCIEMQRQGVKLYCLLTEKVILKWSNDIYVTCKISQNASISRSNIYMKSLKIQIHLALQEWTRISRNPWQIKASM